MINIFFDGNIVNIDAKVGALISKVASIIEKRNPQAKAFKESMGELKSYLVEFQMPKECQIFYDKVLKCSNFLIFQ